MILTILDKWISLKAARATPTAYYLLPTTHYPLPAAHYVLRTTHYRWTSLKAARTTRM